jgi:hypothetical protein
MQNRELAELAALLAEHGPALVQSPGCIPRDAIDQYWLTSRYRLDAWGRALKQFAVTVPPTPRVGSAVSVRGVIEEILVSELLTRVWTAVLCAHDRRRQQTEIEPVARSAFLGHLEARNRALGLLMHAPGVRVEDAVALNRLRGRVERWTDLLIGRLLLAMPRGAGDAAEFAANSARAREFAADLRDDGTAEGQVWHLTVASLRVAFAEGLSSPAPHEALNSRIASAVLGCLPSELFDGTGQIRSPWMLRLASTTADAQGLVADLFDLDAPRRRAPSLPGDRPGWSR